MSSLSNQLAQIAASNATVALDRKRRQKLHSASLIYNPKTAATQDYDFIFDNAVNALRELIEIDPRFEIFSRTLFSESSISIDRNVQTKDEVKDLDNAINGYLLLVSSKWHLTPALHATEWLVRRFQIHIVNAEMLLLSTLNYYQTPVFSRILNITKIPPLFNPLTNFVRNEKPTTNLTIVKLFNDMAFLKLYVNYISKCIKQKTTYTNQLLFITCCFINVVAFNSNNEDKLNQMVPILLEVSAKLLGSDSQDCQIAAHTVLVVFATALPLKKVIILAATETILTNLEDGEAKKSAMVSICKLFQTLKGQGNIDQLPGKLYKLFDDRMGMEYLITFLNKQDGQSSDKFVTAYVRAIARYDHSKLSSIVKILKTIQLEKFEIRALITDLIHLSEILEDKSQLIEIFEYFISINEKLVLSCLRSLNISPDIFEIRLTTSLFSSHNEDVDIVKNLESEKVVGKKTDVPLFKEFLDKNSQYIYTKDTSLLVEPDESFIKLLSLFTEAVGNKYSTGQFLTTFFTTIEARITFLLRVIVSPSAPVALKLISLTSISKYLHNIDRESNVFSLVPSLIVALNDASKNVRIAVKKVLTQISKRPFSKHYFLSKKIYGDDISIPQLSPKDAGNWLSKFIEEYMVDNFDISSLMIPKKNDKIYLLFWSNQALYIPLPYAKAVLLGTLEKTSYSPSLYSQLFESSIKEYLTNRSRWELRCKQNKTNFVTFEKAIVGLISMKEKNQYMIDFILNALKSDYEQLSVLVAERLISIFGNLKSSQQLEIVQSIIDSSLNADLSYDYMSLLQALPLSAKLFAQILNQNRITSDDESNGLPKRRRRQSSSTKSAFQKEEISLLAVAHLQKITIILDTLNKFSNVGTTDLLSALFVLLADLETLDQDGGLPVLYAQETLTACMLNTIQALKENGHDELKNIRADILVSAIRNSPSPQLQNKLLLVVGALATLNPEIILHSIMPIFTFMGAHSIRQDDSFTIQVVEKTILTVVPALLANRNAENSDEIEVLLMSFTTALQHVPKHRRVALFSTLLSALGSNVSIGPFIFLITQQYAINMDNFKLAEAKSIVEFAKSLLTRFDVSDELNGINQCLTYFSQITNAASNPESKSELSSNTLFTNGVLNKTFLETVTFVQHGLAFIDKIIKDDDSDYFSANGSFKLRVHSTLFDDNVVTELASTIRDTFSSILEQVLSFINDSHKLKEKKSEKSGISVDQEREFSGILFSLLGNVLNILPIGDFVKSVLPLLNISNSKDVKYHISLVIADKFELESLESIGAATDVTKSLLQRIPEEFEEVNVAQVMLNTLATLIDKFGANFDAKFITETMNLGIMGMSSGSNEIIVSSLAVINNCIQKMGVKCIAFYPKIVPRAIKIFDDLRKDEANVMKKPLQLAILLLFATMIKTIPSFLTSNLYDVLNIIFYSNEVESPTRLSVIELIINFMELREVLKVLSKIWDASISTTRDSIAVSLFLSTLEASVEAIDKKSATVQSPVFFKLLLVLFEYRSISSFDNNTISRIEATVYKIANAYVLKMNDKVFRPLFVILVKWAFDAEGVTNREITEVERLTAFFKFFNKLQENLRGIVTSYFTYLLERTTSLLNRFISKDIVDINLHRLLLNSLTSSFKYDRDEYWKSTSRFELLCEPLVNQLSVIENPIGKYLVKAIGSFAANNNGAEEHNQIMNKLLINHMKASCSSREKLWSVRSVKLIYSKVGESWLGLLPQLVPTIAELLEDDDEEVESEVRTGLVKVVENVLGEPFDRYLD